MTREQFEAREAALEESNVAYCRLVERIKLASKDGYDVLPPNVLAGALMEVARAQLDAQPAEPNGAVEAFKSEYERQRDAIDRRFPRPLH